MKTYTTKDKTRLKQTGFLFALKRVASFVWPVPVKKVKSDTTELEVVLYQNRLMLNTAKANYSFGNLQTAFARLFREYRLPWLEIKRVLVLGFGAGGVSQLIHKYSPHSSQVGVEGSKEVLGLYNICFKLLPYVRVVEAEAYQYVRSETERYDLVIVDLYNDLDVPDEFQSQDFISMLYNLLESNGVVIFNKVVSNDKQKLEFQELLLTFSGYFRSVEVNEQMGLNRFIVAKKTK